MASPLRQVPSGVLVTIRVIPRASGSAVAGVRDDALLVRLTAPPVDGAANDALIKLLARTCDVPSRAITVLAGERGRRKTVQITGMTAEAVARCLGLEPEAAGATSSTSTPPSRRTRP
ncbi:MAG: DUF167 domain-containing protein [Vicinamibacterales bacterium]